MRDYTNRSRRFTRIFYGNLQSKGYGGSRTYNAVRTGLKREILLIPISVGFLCSVVLVGMYFIGIVLQLDNVFSAQYFIPIFGILMGNMLSSNVIALNTYYSGLKREQQLYCYLLGNGATRQEAQAPFIREAIIKSFSH